MNHLMRIMLGWCFVLAWLGCTPLSEEEEAYFQAREEERQQREAFAASIEFGAEEQKAISKVKEHIFEGEDDTQEEWVLQQMDLGLGMVIYRKWEAKKIDDEVFDVSFEFTRVLADGKTERDGFVWNVDFVVDMVKPPRRIEKRISERRVSERNKSSQKRRLWEHAQQTLE